MSRAAKKRAARERRRKRRDLVHAAGCTDPNCCVRREAFGGFAMINEACADGVPIPRSLDRWWAQEWTTLEGEYAHRWLRELEDER